MCEVSYYIVIKLLRYICGGIEFDKVPMKSDFIRANSQQICNILVHILSLKR